MLRRNGRKSRGHENARSEKPYWPVRSAEIDSTTLLAGGLGVSSPRVIPNTAILRYDRLVSRADLTERIAFLFREIRVQYAKGAAVSATDPDMHFRLTRRAALLDQADEALRQAERHMVAGSADEAQESFITALSLVAQAVEMPL
jgi:hypothetical protein